MCKFAPAPAGNILITMVIGLLSGCGTWVNTRDPMAGFDLQRHDCEVMAEAKLPPRFFGGGTWPGLVVQSHCFRTNGRIVCHPILPGNGAWPEDINAMARQQEIQRCLAEAGWVYAPRQPAIPVER